MALLFGGLIALVVWLRMNGWLTFYRPQSPSPFHLQLTLWGRGLTIKKPDA